MSFGSRLAKARKAKGLTQAQLAEKVGVSRRVIISYEQKKTTPRGLHRENLEEVFGVNLDNLGTEDDFHFQPIGIDYESVIGYSKSNKDLALTFSKLFEYIERLTNGHISPMDREGIDELKKLAAIYKRQESLMEKMNTLQQELDDVNEEISTFRQESEDVDMKLSTASMSG